MRQHFSIRAREIGDEVSPFFVHILGRIESSGVSSSDRDESLIDRLNHARLTGGIERWLYRLVRKHGGKQEYGWQFDFRYLHQKSGSTAKPYDFACDLRALVARQSLPGYVLGIERMPDNGMELLTFRPVPHTARG